MYQREVVIVMYARTVHVDTYVLKLKAGDWFPHFGISEKVPYVRIHECDLNMDIITIMTTR